MSTITLKGNPVQTLGDLPALGSKAPAFTLVKDNLEELTSESLLGNKVILNVFPSVDTGTCATSVRRFNQEASQAGVTVVCVSMDLPFALGRFCGTEGIDKVTTASGFRSDFGSAYGLVFTDGPLKGLYSRSVIVLSEQGEVLYTEQVQETTDEPNYEAALAAL